MPPITSFRDLIAWQKAMDLADLVYDVTEAFPRREWFDEVGRLTHGLLRSLGPSDY